MLVTRPSLTPPLLLTLGFRPLTSALLTNEAGILLMHKDLQKYVGNAAAVGSMKASEFRLLAPDFCSQVQVTVTTEKYRLQRRGGAESRTRPECGKE